MMNGLQDNLIKKLQRVHNTILRLVFNLRKYDRIIRAIIALHRLPVKHWIEFKTLLIVFKGLHGMAPAYIPERSTPSKSKWYSIRPNKEIALKVPKFKHDTFGRRAFVVYGSLAWICLPKEIRLCDEIKALKQNLKTHLCIKLVNESTLATGFWRIIGKRPRMLYARFMALYKLCKLNLTKPNPINLSPLKLGHGRISTPRKLWYIVSMDSAPWITIELLTPSQDLRQAVWVFNYINIFCAWTFIVCLALMTWIIVHVRNRVLRTA